MFKTLKNILKTGDSTVKYPFAPLEQIEHTRGKPEHDLEQCIACAACAVACPANAIQMKTDAKDGNITWEICYGRCIFCGRCEEVCPVHAIELTSEFELAVMTKDDLYEQAHYSLATCKSCGKPFAPRKEIDYAARIIGSMEQRGEVKDSLENLYLCSDCKRVKDGVAAKKADDSQGAPTRSAHELLAAGGASEKAAIDLAGIAGVNTSRVPGVQGVAAAVRSGVSFKADGTKEDK